MTSNFLKWSISLLVFLLLTGCAGLLESREPPAATYLLRPQTPSLADGLAAADLGARSSLQVQRVVAYPGYDTDRILLARPDRRLDVYAGSRWADSLPKVVEAMTIDALRQSGQFTAVHDSLASQRSDYLLRLSVRRFEAEYDDLSAAPQIRVAFEVDLMRRTERDTTHSIRIETTATATANRLTAIVAAFEQASSTALAELLAEIKRHQAGQRSP